MATNKKSFLSLSRWRDYLIQVSLIILSLLAAVGVDRCNQNLKDQKRLGEYLETMAAELEYEQEANMNNFGDCKKDINGLAKALALLPSQDDAEVVEGIQHVAGVLVRGVFRSFEPLTYERMQTAGDLFLLEDLELRESLSSYASFRNDYLKQDLMTYDKMILEAIDRLSVYLDLSCLRSEDLESPTDCIKDRTALGEKAAADLTKLYRLSTIRGFHLQLSSRTLGPSLERVNSALGREKEVEIQE